MSKITDIKQQTVDNEYFRRVLATGNHTQVVIMHIPAGGEIGMETHPDNDQFLYLVSGKGTVSLDGEISEFNVGDAVLVKAGVEHNFVASDDQPMKIITTYAPPHHPEGTVHETKAIADAAEADE